MLLFLSTNILIRMRPEWHKRSLSDSWRNWSSLHFLLLLFPMTVYRSLCKNLSFIHMTSICVTFICVTFICVTHIFYCFLECILSDTKEAGVTGGETDPRCISSFRSFPWPKTRYSGFKNSSFIYVIKGAPPGWDKIPTFFQKLYK